MAGRDTGLPKHLANLFPDRLVNSELGLIPEGWEISPVGEEVDVVGGATPSTKESAYWNDGHHHWATPKDLSNLLVPVLLDTDRKITDAGVKKITSGLLPVGTVLLLIARTYRLFSHRCRADRYKPRLHRHDLREAPTEFIRAFLVLRNPRPH